MNAALGTLVIVFFLVAGIALSANHFIGVLRDAKKWRAHQISINTNISNKEQN